MDMYKPDGSTIGVHFDAYGNSYFNPTAGGVGIGTDSPSSLLNVVRSEAVSDNATVNLADFSFTKTGGDADQNTLITGLKASAIHNDSNSGFGNIVGGEFNATHTQNKNSAGNGDNVIAVSANASHVAGIVNTVNGVNAYVNVDAGTIDQYVVGSNITMDIESAVNITGDVYGQKIYMDVDDTNAAQVWGLEIEDAGSGNWDGAINTSLSDGYAISGSAKSTGSFGRVENPTGNSNSFMGKLGIGTATPAARLDVNSANGVNAIFRGDDSDSTFSISSDQTNNSVGYTITRSDAATALTFDGHNMNLTIGGSYSPFTAAHTAKLIDDEEYHYGELVQIQGLIQSGKDIVYQVNKTTGSYQRNVLGAFGYVEDSQFNNTAVSRSSADDEFMIYVVGDGHILCNGEKGNIAVGDGICLSTTAGQRMKADKMAMIIGIAQASASFSGSETQLVPVQYGLQQFTPWTD